MTAARASAHIDTILVDVVIRTSPVHSIEHILPGKPRGTGLRAAIGSAKIRREKMPVSFSRLDLPRGRIEIVVVPPRMEVNQKWMRTLVTRRYEEALLPVTID